MNFPKISFWGDQNGAGVPKIDLQRLSKMFWKFWYFFQKIQTTLENVDPEISQNRLKWLTKIAENHEFSQNFILRRSEWCRGAKNWFTAHLQRLSQIFWKFWDFFKKFRTPCAFYIAFWRNQCRPKNQSNMQKWLTKVAKNHSFPKGLFSDHHNDAELP